MIALVYGYIPYLILPLYAALDRIDWSRLAPQDRLDLLRAYSLVFIRLGSPDDRATQLRAGRLLQRMRDDAVRKDPLDVLTDQERKILELIGEGLTNREIGERMFLAEKTVKNYVSSVLSKLGLVRRTQAAVMVTELRSQQHP